MDYVTLLFSFHLLGIGMGFVGTAIWYYQIFRKGVSAALRGRSLKRLQNLSRFILAGLFIAWCAGIELSGSYLNRADIVDVETKLWVKISITAILTLSTVFVHLILLRHRREEAKNQRPAETDVGTVFVIVSTGTTALISWASLFHISVTPLSTITTTYEGLLSGWMFTVLLAIAVILMIVAVQEFFKEDTARKLALKRAKFRFADDGRPNAH